jgi:hypothetical protein
LRFIAANPEKITFTRWILTDEIKKIEFMHFQLLQGLPKKGRVEADLGADVVVRDNSRVFTGQHVVGERSPQLVVAVDEHEVGADAIHRLLNCRRRGEVAKVGRLYRRLVA